MHEGKEKQVEDANEWKWVSEKMGVKGRKAEWKPEKPT